ncbi:hypothetical protein FRC00_004658 [Tulasnella sp. 408]|nr:hypothetical protein FRC00_004658 [Tulasnella sp. 408]
MRSEAPPTEGQPPPNTPATPARDSGTPENVRNSNLEKRLESLKSEIALTLKNTEWPTESEVAAEALLNTIVASPNIPTNMESMTQEVPKLVEQYAQTLEDVRLRLKDASSKSEMKRWKLLQRIKSLASNRPSKCTLLFHTCQDDVSKAINSLNERLDYERAKGVDGLVPLSEPQLHSIAQLAIQEPPAGTAEHTIASDDPAPPPSNTSTTRKARGPISDGALIAARKTFKGVEIASGAIPVVGSYVGATAKVGLAFVEMLQTMDRNDNTAIDLGEHTSKLIGLLKNFNGKSMTEEQDIANRIKDVHEELGQLKAKVEEWSSLGGFKRALSARDHAELLKEYQGKIQTVQEEIQKTTKYAKNGVAS